MSVSGIITGIIILPGEMKAVTREKLFTDLHRQLKEWSKKWISRWDTYRGDSLLCEVRSPELSLRVALLLRAYFLAYKPVTSAGKGAADGRKTVAAKGNPSGLFDSKLAAGIGVLTNPYGEAFRLSKDALDRLERIPAKLGLNTSSAVFNEQMEPAILLADALIEKWTQNQAELMLHKLQGKKEDVIAALLRISQSAVNQRAKTAKWSAIAKLLEYFEQTAETRLAVYSVPA